MNKFKRNCPEYGCSSIIYYKSLKNKDLAELEKRKCQKCCRKGENNGMFNKKSPLRGKKWEDFRTPNSIKESKKKLSLGLFRDYKHTDKSKSKISKSSSGEKNGFFGKNHTLETRQNLRNKALNQLKTKGNTNIELIFENYLKELKINYRKQEIYGFWSFDFYLIDLDIYIECDGDYWHRNLDNFSNKKITFSQSKNIANDKRKNNFMKKNDKKLLRFWENDIINNKKYILSLLKNL